MMNKQEAQKELGNATNSVEDIVKSGYYTLDEVIAYIQDTLVHLWE